jgi:hypothetical protein
MMLLLTSAAVAQSADTSINQASLSEGNVYHYRDHQPTQAGDAALGVAPPSAAARQRVEKEVEELLRQSRRLDKQSEAK